MSITGGGCSCGAAKVRQVQAAHKKQSTAFVWGMCQWTALHEGLALLRSCSWLLQANFAPTSTLTLSVDHMPQRLSRFLLATSLPASAEPALPPLLYMWHDKNSGRSTLKAPIVQSTSRVSLSALLSPGSSLGQAVLPARIPHTSSFKRTLSLSDTACNSLDDPPQCWEKG